MRLGGGWVGTRLYIPPCCITYGTLCQHGDTEYSTYHLWIKLGLARSVDEFWRLFEYYEAMAQMGQARQCAFCVGIEKAYKTSEERLKAMYVRYIGEAS